MSEKSTAPRLTVIADCWQIYERAVIPPDASRFMRGATRSAFYAGVAFLFDTMIANSDDEGTGFAMLDSVNDELEAYARNLAANAGIDLAAMRAVLAAKRKIR